LVFTSRRAARSFAGGRRSPGDPTDLYKQIAREIRRAIAEGEAKPGYSMLADSRIFSAAFVDLAKTAAKARDISEFGGFAAYLRARAGRP
jgi:hypothetical protein